MSLGTEAESYGFEYTRGSFVITFCLCQCLNIYVAWKVKNFTLFMLLHKSESASLMCATLQKDQWRRQKTFTKDPLVKAFSLIRADELIFRALNHLRNELNFWNVHGIMNTLGLLKSKWSPKCFTLTLQETQSIHDSMNRPKIQFVAYIYILL